MALGPFKPLGTLTAWARILAIAWFTSTVLVLVLSMLPFGGFTPLFLTPISIGAYVVGAMWCYRASVNAHHLHPDMKWAPGWAAGSWFIPIANAILPILIIPEIVRASVSRGEAWRTSPMPGGTLGWAITWVVYSVGSFFVGAIAFVVAFREGLAGDTADSTNPWAGLAEPAFVPGSVQFWLSAVGAVLFLVVLPFWLNVLSTIESGQGGAAPASPARGHDEFTAPAFR